MSYPQRHSIDIWNLSVQDLPVYADWQGNRMELTTGFTYVVLTYSTKSLKLQRECKFPVGVNLILFYILRFCKRSSRQVHELLVVSNMPHARAYIDSIHQWPDYKISWPYSRLKNASILSRVYYSCYVGVQYRSILNYKLCILKYLFRAWFFFSNWIKPST